MSADQSPEVTGPGASSEAEPAARPPRDPGALVAGLFLVAFGIVLFWNAWERDFWNPDEPRLALKAKAMETSGSWLVPLVDGRPALDVPPLVPWLAAAVHQLTGWSPRFSYRLPAALAAFLGLLFTYLAGKKLFDGRVGFLAAAIHASTLAYYQRSGWLDDDLFFAVFCQLALTSFAIATRRGSRRYWSWLGWVGLAGAALAKSALLGIGLVFCPLFLFLLFEPGEGTVGRGMRRVVTPAGLVIFLLLAAPWYIAMGLEHGVEFLKDHFIRQHFARLVNAESHPRLPYYYILAVGGGFLPWTIFLPLALLHGKDRLRRTGERFAMLAALFTLVALSFISSKKLGYVLAAWPPLALLIAAALFETRERYSLWEDFLRDGVARLLPLLLRLPLVLTAALAALHAAGVLPRSVAFVLKALGSWPDGSEEGTAAEGRIADLLADSSGMLFSLGLLTLAGVLCLVVSRRVGSLARSRESTRCAFEFACATLFLFFVSSFFHERMNTVKSSRPFLENVAGLVGEAPLATLRTRRPAIVDTMVYELEKPLAHMAYPDLNGEDDSALKKLEAYLLRSDEVYVLSSSGVLKDLKQHFPALGRLLHERLRGYLGWTPEYVLLSNKPNG